MRVVLLLFLLRLSHLSYAQNEISLNSKSPKFIYSLQLSAENGFMLKNGTPNGNQIVDNSYYNGLDVRYGWTMRNTEDTYNKVYRFPTMGIGWYTSTFHNSTLGKPHAFYFFFMVPIRFEDIRKWTGSYTGAFGLSYNFNPYDQVTNPTNIYIGSELNCYLNMSYILNYHINKKSIVFLSAGYKHFSNGSMVKPNSGINLFPLSIGIRYKFSEEQLLKPKFQPEPFIKQNLFNIMVAAGIKNYKIGDPAYFKTTLGVNYLHQKGFKYRYGLGIDFFYASQSEVRNHSSQSPFSKSVSYALVGSWEWVINRIISVPIGFGYYLHHNFLNDELTPYYQRVGLRFRITDHYNLGVTIKGHSVNADIFEWTLAYTLHKDANHYR